MAIEDIDGDVRDIFRSGKGCYWNRNHFVEMEKNNPHGLGDYPRRMIVRDKEEKDEREERENYDDSSERRYSSY